MLFDHFFVVVFLLKFQNKNGFAFNFTSLQKCSTNEFFNLKTITSCHYIQHLTLHNKLLDVAITNLKCKIITFFYQFLFLFSGDVSLNPGPDL